MEMNFLVFNAGSTSLKFGLFDPDCEPRVEGSIDWAHGDPARAVLTMQPAGQPAVRREVSLSDSREAPGRAIGAVQQTMGAAGRSGGIAAVGHRVVHGGTAFRESALVTPEVKAAVARLCALAPLHNPPALAAIDAAEMALPGVPQVAVFDTAFYAQLPPHAYVFALPYEWLQDWGIRRFGFHGLSHAYCAARAAELLKRDPGGLRVVSCHLGGGCSATAVRGGLAVATTMGFSPLDGLMMGTRPGSMDPGLLLHLQREHGLSLADLDQALNHRSGLLGVSGVSGDLARIEAAAAAGDTRAQLAFDLFADQVCRAIASLAASLGGLDAVVFTDRIGEGSPALRAAACERLEFMGVKLDSAVNRAARADIDVAAAGSAVRVLVLHTREEVMAARETRRVVGIPAR